MFAFPESTRPITVAQFGGGVFLRGFFDWMLQVANNRGLYHGNAVIIRAKTLGEDPLARHGYHYTQLMQDGTHDERLVVDSIAGSIQGRDAEALLALATLPGLSVVVSNTTEAGIVYIPTLYQKDEMPESFPARLARMLYARYQAGLEGLLVLPCELIEDNGEMLARYVKQHAKDWQLDEGFFTWLDASCSFRNTLVDRIVSGVPDGDPSINHSEYFHLWAIEGALDARLPFAEAGLNIKWVPDLSVYRTRKVRILNGAHTSMIPYALSLGIPTVGACMQDARTREHLEGCMQEIVLSLGEDNRGEIAAYADAVLSRFSNPYIEHRCEAIALNSVSKFRVRVLPSILAYHKITGTYPRQLLFAFASLIRFYREGAPRDEAEVIYKMRTLALVDLLRDIGLWGEDLTALYPTLSTLLGKESL